MAAEEEHECPECPPEGLPAYMGTFADLMALLMCFFVLLLSFSEMDVQKYKRVAGSMAAAFGVQREISAKEIPKGTSVIAKNFSPGKPLPTAVPQMRQMTTNDMKNNLDFSDSQERKNQSKGNGRVDQTKNGEGSEDNASDAERAERLEEVAHKLRVQLRGELANDLLSIEVIDGRVIVTIREQGLFPSGASALRPEFLPTLFKLSTLMATLGQKIMVAGHSDNIPIKTQKFASNWELSAARAASVVHFMSTRGRVPENMLEIRAYADTKAVADNDTPAGRAKNRRVEVVLYEDLEESVDSEPPMSADGVAPSAVN